MDQLSELKAQFLSEGGTEAEFDELGGGHLGRSELELQDGCMRPREARALALKCLGRDALIEVQCYNSRGRSQGKEVLIFESWVLKAELTFKASHLVASDDRYEWWATHEADYSRMTFHICEVAGNRCRCRGPTGEEMVHLTRWRMVSPVGLAVSDYASARALGYFKKILQGHLERRTGVPRVGTPV